MLSAFQPQQLLELKSRDKSKIESVLAYDERLLVSLSTGNLRIYRVNHTESSDDGAPLSRPDSHDSALPRSKEAPQPLPSAVPHHKPRISIDLLRELEKFSKQKIDQLALIKDAEAFLALSNSQVHVYGLESFELRETLSKSKGASTLAVFTKDDFSNSEVDNDTYKATKLSRVAVAVKRRFLIWDWVEGQMKPEAKEITLASGIKSLFWVNSRKLIVGLGSNYVLVDCDTGGVTDIVGPGSIGGAPGQDGGRFGGAGVAGMGYLGMTAPTPLATRSGDWEILLAKDINTHFIDGDGNPLGRRQIPWAIAPEAVGYSAPFLLALQAAKGVLEVRNPKTLTLLQSLSLPSANRFHIPPSAVKWAFPLYNFLVLSDRAVWRIKPLSCDAQIDDLVEQGHLDEAISLLEMLESSRLNDKFARTREVKMLKAQILFDQHRFRDSIDLFTEVSAPPERVIALYPPFIAGATSMPSTTHSKDAVDATSDSQPSTPRHKRKPSSIHSQSEQIRIPWSPTKARSLWTHGKDTHKPLEGKALKTATEELRGFLVSTRTKMKKVLNPDGTLKSDGLDEIPNPELAALLVKSSFDASLDHEQLLQTAKLVDTTLFRAYMFVSPSFAGPLFRIDNFCDPDVVNEKLTEAGRYNDLVDFFNGKKMHKEALELLRRFGDAEKSKDEAPELAGPLRTVTYLQNLPPEKVDLILEFAEWPLRRDPNIGMEVFLAETENAETLPRSRILDFLEKIDLNLAVKYLEHIIHEWNDTTPQFHQRLVEIYVQRLKSGYFANDKERADWNEKVLEFLKSSRSYQAFKVLVQIDKDDPKLYEARAIILGNMGQHKQALDIYVFQLEDPEKAEEYCNQIYMSETSQTSGHPLTRQTRMLNGEHEDEPSAIYHTLLSLYLSPPPPHKPQWDPALAILARHGARIPASLTLKLIPESLPVKDLESYFQGRLRNANSIVNEGRVISGLRNALAFSEEAKLRLGDGTLDGNAGRSRRVVISEDRVCGVCYKRFGGSAVKVLPDNSVVHYGCSVR